MSNLIKMDFYRLLKTKSVVISTIVLLVFNFAISIFVVIITNTLVRRFTSEDVQIMTDKNLTDIIISPFALSLLLIFLLIAVVTFSYADLANGYIKNIAGQVKNKGNTVISKFVVVAVYTFIVLLLVFLTNLAGSAIVLNITIGDNIGHAVAIFFVKWILIMGMTSILLFVTTGLKNKTLASVVGVILGSEMLTFAYMGLNNLFSKFDITEYAPDQLVGATDLSIINSTIVGVVMIAVFITLTVKAFNKNDVK